jgi:hypothetical protein
VFRDAEPCRRLWWSPREPGRHDVRAADVEFSLQRSDRPVLDATADRLHVGPRDPDDLPCDLWAYPGYVSTPSTSTPSRVERILAFMLIGVFGASVIALFVVLIATWAGTNVGGGAWPVVAMTPYFGLPLAFVLLFALLVIATVRRARSAKRDDGI